MPLNCLYMTFAELSLYLGKIAKTPPFFSLHLGTPLLNERTIGLKLSHPCLKFCDTRFTLHASVNGHRRLLLQFLNLLLCAASAPHHLPLPVIHQLTS